MTTRSRAVARYGIIAICVGAIFMVSYCAQQRVDALKASVKRLDAYCVLVRASLFVDERALAEPRNRDRAFLHFDGQGGHSSRDEIALCAPHADLEQIDACIARRDAACLATAVRAARGQIASPKESP